MARGLPKVKEQKKTLSSKRKRSVKMDMALLEYARTGSSWEAEQITDLHHTTIQRAWDKLSEEERDIYYGRANTICDVVAQKITNEEVEAICEVTEKLREISNLALDEIRARLTDDIRRMEMKDADLINIATKAIAIVDENTRTKEDDKSTTPASVTTIFNIFDNAIQENLTLKSYDNENK
jgi:hypothetical protein